MAKSVIQNHQRGVRIAVASLERFCDKASRELQLPPESFAVSLVTPAKIARWNGAYRAKPRPTDVLSFPADSQNARNARNGRPRARFRREEYLGDIAIAPLVAKRNAVQFKRTLDQEMRILLLHGILHLIGYDHETDTGQMERRERRLRRKLGLG
jgi:probable rRNA maturation factor